jgi:hypothetical protein
MTGASLTVTDCSFWDVFAFLGGIYHKNAQSVKISGEIYDATFLSKEFV